MYMSAWCSISDVSCGSGSPFTRFAFDEKKRRDGWMLIQLAAKEANKYQLESPNKLRPLA